MFAPALLFLSQLTSNVTVPSIMSEDETCIVRIMTKVMQWKFNEFDRGANKLKRILEWIYKNKEITELHFNKSELEKFKQPMLNLILLKCRKLVFKNCADFNSKYLKVILKKIPACLLMQNLEVSRMNLYRTGHMFQEIIPNLVTLVLKNSMLTNKQKEEIFETIEASEKIKNIDFSNVYLGNIPVKQFVRSIIKLESVKIREAGLVFSQIIALFNSLEDNTGILKHLDISGNDTRIVPNSTFANAITNLEDAKIVGKLIVSETQIRALFNRLSDNESPSKLKELDISTNSLLSIKHALMSDKMKTLKYLTIHLQKKQYPQQTSALSDLLYLGMKSRNLCKLTITKSKYSKEPSLLNHVFDEMIEKYVMERTIEENFY